MNSLVCRGIIAQLLVVQGMMLSACSAAESEELAGEQIAEQQSALEPVPPGTRRNIYDLSSAERQTLANAILAFINQPILDEHRNAHDWHHPANGELFFIRHHDYLNKLETYLKSNGFAQLVPLPEWDPATPIPSEFMVADPLVSQAPMNQNPNRPMPAQFNNLCAFTSASTLAQQVESWHDGVHVAIGGPMGAIASAPGAPIFWLWHGFLDDLYHNFQLCSSATSGAALSDRYVTGNFDGVAGDDLLAINPNGWHHTMKFDGSSWQFLEGDGSGKIFWWNIGSADKYVTGDFNGDGRDELLAINPNGWHHTMKFNGSSWQFLEGDGSGKIFWWNIGSADRYVTGDFDGDGRDELLAINPNGWHHTMKFNGSSWQFLEGDGSGKIFWWNLGPADKYVTGDFNGDGRDELLAINPNGWHHTMRFNGSGWQFLEGDGSGKIFWWNIGTADTYSRGDFNGDGRDELLATNPNGWHHTMSFNGSSWQFIEGNGDDRIAWWNIGANDAYVTGDFDGNLRDDLLAVNRNGWHHTMSFNGSSWALKEGNGSGQIFWWKIN